MAKQRHNCKVVVAIVIEVCFHNPITCLVANPNTRNKNNGFTSHERFLKAMDNIRKGKKHFDNAYVDNNGEVVLWQSK